MSYVWTSTGFVRRTLTREGIETARACRDRWGWLHGMVAFDPDDDGPIYRLIGVSVKTRRPLVWCRVNKAAGLAAHQVATAHLLALHLGDEWPEQLVPDLSCPGTYSLMENLAAAYGETMSAMTGSGQGG